MSGADESDAQDGMAGAHSADLSLEFERIDEEKERLRRLATQLGLKHASPDEQKTPPQRTPPKQARTATPRGENPLLPAGDPKATVPRKAHVRRPSLPLSRTPAAPPANRRASIRSGEGGRIPTPLLESLSGFVPVALFDEMKRERDELFFRLTKLEVERTQLDQLRRALSGMETEVRRLESEIQRRRKLPAARHAEPLRLCYRRWLMLRRRRALMFTDYLACRRSEREED